VHVRPYQQQGRDRKEPDLMSTPEGEQKQQQGKKEIAEVLWARGQTYRHAGGGQYRKSCRPQPTSTRSSPPRHSGKQRGDARPGRDQPVGNGTDVVYRPGQKYLETPFFGQPRAP
jgi:hypothetical protein